MHPCAALHLLDEPQRAGSRHNQTKRVGACPEEQVCVLRSYLRHRQMLFTSATYHIQHMQKALQQMKL
jgi:hypothetical protein